MLGYNIFHHIINQAKVVVIYLLGNVRTKKNILGFSLKLLTTIYISMCQIANVRRIFQGYSLADFCFIILEAHASFVLPNKLIPYYIYQAKREIHNVVRNNTSLFTHINLVEVVRGDLICKNGPMRLVLSSWST